MRQPLLVSLAVFAGLVCAMPVMPALADAPLTGWDKLNFGMSPDQVKAVKGMAWNELTRIAVPGGLSTMDTKKPVTVFGVKYSARLTFDGASKLDTIDLVSNQELAAARCDALTRKVLAAAETRYGVFAPDPKLIKPDMGGLAYETAGTGSRLVVQTTDSPDIGKTVISETRHVSGTASVQVSTDMVEPVITEDGQKQAHLCEMHVVFHAK